HNRGQREEHVAREAAVRRVHAHLTQNLEALAHHVRQVVENLRQVAAGFALDDDGRHEEADVEERHALAQLIQRVAERQAEVLLVVSLLELGIDRLGELLGYPAMPWSVRVAVLNWRRT